MITNYWLILITQYVNRSGHYQYLKKSESSWVSIARHEREECGPARELERLARLDAIQKQRLQVEHIRVERAPLPTSTSRSPSSGALLVRRLPQATRALHAEDGGIGEVARLDLADLVRAQVLRSAQFTVDRWTVEARPALSLSLRPTFLVISYYYYCMKHRCCKRLEKPFSIFWIIYNIL